MKLQFRIFFYMMCLNVGSGLVIGLMLPGTENVQPTSPVNATEYQEQFNATETASQWTSSPFSGIPVIGDIFSAFQMLREWITYLTVGFPLLLSWMGDSFLLDASGRAAFDIIIAGVVALEAILGVMFVLEYISGRVITD